MPLSLDSKHVASTPSQHCWGSLNRVLSRSLLDFLATENRFSHLVRKLLRSGVNTSSPVLLTRGESHTPAATYFKVRHYVQGSLY